jgi:predicted branched-subunit amino acid permease
MEKVTLQIGLILLACILALVYGFLHSRRSRRLAVAALIIVATLIILYGLWTFIIMTWFPAQL